ncbi:MAG: AMP-binding protein [Gammaproteobacteria bacterium]
MQSYVHGVSEIALRGDTVGRSFDRAVERRPNTLALVVPHQQVRLSYAELKRQVDAFAAGLIALGLVPGDRIGVWAPNCREWVVAQFASAKAGLILVNVNPAYRSAELEFALNHVGCKALITAADFKSSNYLEMLGTLCPELEKAGAGDLHAERVPSLRWIIHLSDRDVAGTLRFDEVTPRATDADVEELLATGERLQFDDPINIQFTSGTTGTPKAATLTHHNIVNNAYFAGRQMALTHRDSVCIPVPMYHCFGMVLGTLCCVMHGAAMVLPSAGFDAHATLVAVDREWCTALHGVPTMFIAERDDRDFSKFDLSTLRTGIMAGAPCPEALMRRVMDEMHLRQITIAYGMTETGPVSFQTAVDDPVSRRIETVGRVLPHTEVKIIDTDGRVVPVGTPGELLTRGYCVMPGYWNDPQRTAEAIDRNGWIRSGDLATLDEQGYCRIVGRVKDMLIRGGENVYPREIEELLYQHPKIDQVEVIGVPDQKYGEEICAWIKLHEGEDASAEDMREFCRGRVAHFKVPRYIRFVDAFPLTVTGKVRKFVMRERMAKELGGGRAEQV